MLNEFFNLKFLMYRIIYEDYKIQVVCERCYQKGEVVSTCQQCGGKGVHNKTKQHWVVFKYPCEIGKIDRDSHGNLRYWTEDDCYYQESSKLIHFTYKDALNECKRRNSKLT